MIRIHGIVLFGLLAAFTAEAGDSVIAVAQRATPEGLEQIGLVLASSGAKLTMNSNFLAPPGDTARIGVYTSPLNEELSVELETLRHDLARLEKRTQALKGLSEGMPAPAAQTSPHAIQWLLNGIPLEGGSPAQKTLERLLKRAHKVADWRAHDAVIAKMASKESLELAYEGKRTGQEKVPASKACRKLKGMFKEKSAYACSIPGHGSVYLRGPVL